ncbi:MAG: TonB family protein [Rikenellaceae bacterium]
MAIIFVSAKIIVGSNPTYQGMYIDIDDLEDLKEMRDKLQEQVAQKQKFDWESVKNRSSNENALDERVKDDRGTKVQELTASASQAQKSMEANREAYLKGISEVEAMRNNRDKESTSQGKEQKVEGNVTVSFSLKDPIRYSRHLVVPAYRCEGGGQVKVSITVNRAGEVVEARVSSGGDECMQKTALNAARASRFDINNSAPAKHQGDITYIFIPQ